MQIELDHTSFIIAQFSFIPTLKYQNLLELINLDSACVSYAKSHIVYHGDTKSISFQLANNKYQTINLQHFKFTNFDKGNELMVRGFVSELIGVLSFCSIIQDAIRWDVKSLILYCISLKHERQWSLMWNSQDPTIIGIQNYTVSKDNEMRLNQLILECYDNKHDDTEDIIDLLDETDHSTVYLKDDPIFTKYLIEFCVMTNLMKLK